MKLILLGPPGSGKGTQSGMLRDKFNIPQISTGDLLRKAVSSKTALGIKAREYMDKGHLVPDELVLDMIRERLQQEDCKNGYVLDGFPRTVVQAEKLDEMLASVGEKLDEVIDLEVNPEEILVRLTGRRTCRSCNAMFHETLKPAKQPAVCDHCGGELYQRADDNEETVMNRLKEYENKTAPLKEFYRKQGNLKSAKGSGSMDDIFDRICSLVS
ncbi:MAG: adenylate kinase [Candidatus Nitronauta litoralis]|uniref:Adenylate kinase n=1 Tax=Candidatus Nitronauta litoralis TaxID=2705533 RepID=A0A7T0BVJ6_9BACT|nr:MAG: adenylate kinase [Candidatus Nitronauta litoralis]